MKLPALTIGELTLRYPIIQGGMGVGISRGQLAGAVSKAGGLGVISTAQIGYDEAGFEENPPETNWKAIHKHIALAKEISGNKPVGANIMVATRGYARYVEEACKAGVDVIISGAGLPLSLPEYTAGWPKVKLAPIVSSARAAKLILKMWEKKYKKTADLLVIEGPMAGGHLGFTGEEAQNLTKEEYEKEILAIIDVAKEYEQHFDKPIPVIFAGGVFDHADICHALSLGAAGVQIATPFVVTEECDASMAYKQAYLDAKKEDIRIVKSPVGMPGRAIHTPFLDRDEKGLRGKCLLCLEHCKPAEIPYCITRALIAAVKGDLENGLVFSGANAWRLTEMTTVPKLMKALAGEEE